MTDWTKTKPSQMGLQPSEHTIDQIASRFTDSVAQELSAKQDACFTIVSEKSGKRVHDDLRIYLNSDIASILYSAMREGIKLAAEHLARVADTYFDQCLELMACGVKAEAVIHSPLMFGGEPLTMDKLRDSIAKIDALGPIATHIRVHPDDNAYFMKYTIDGVNGACPAFQGLTIEYDINFTKGTIEFGRYVKHRLEPNGLAKDWQCLKRVTVSSSPAPAHTSSDASQPGHQQTPEP